MDLYRPQPVETNLVLRVVQGDWKQVRLTESDAPGHLTRVQRGAYMCSLASGSQLHMVEYRFEDLTLEVTVGLTRARFDPKDAAQGFPYNLDNFLVARNTRWQRLLSSPYVCFGPIKPESGHWRQTIEDLLDVPVLDGEGWPQS